MNPGFEIAGTTAEGLGAIGKGGAEAGRELRWTSRYPAELANPKIRAEWPPVYIVILSTLTEVGARVTVDALIHGANEFVSKTAHADATGVPAAERLNVS